MRVLVINGSPRKKGNVATMLHSVADNIKDADVHWLDVNDLQVHPCIGCMKCRATGVCVLPEDDGHRIAEEIAQCDALIMGTPVYWGNMSGQMKLVFDRIVPAMMEDPMNGFPKPLHKGKKAVIVTACTTIWPFSWLCRETTNTLHAMKEILNYSGFKVIGALVLPGTRKRKDFPKKLMDKGKKLAKAIR
ncbi:MAG: flavodoxin family protein [Fibrobacteraceae bacterium]